MLPENTYFLSYSRTAVIYIGCIVCCFIALAAMPYLKTDVSVRSSALIRPASEVNTIRSIASGRVKEAYLAENKKVKEGDLLYVIESETMNEQEHFAQEKISLKETLIKDVEMILVTSQSPVECGVNFSLGKAIFHNHCHRIGQHGVIIDYQKTLG